MSVCATGCDGHGGCVGCAGRQPAPDSYAARAAARQPYKPEYRLSKKKREELEHMLEELEGIKREARKLTKSGHPGVRAEALRHLENARQDLAWLRAELKGSKR